MTEENIGTVTCPECKSIQKMEIPTNMCIPFYKCEGCEKVISAKEGCCVFCDYGDKACPVGQKAST